MCIIVLLCAHRTDLTSLKELKFMLSEQRYEEILNLLNREGSVKATALCKLLGTSRETIRRDLENMEAKGMLRRIHGGAMKVDTSLEKSLSYTSFNKKKRGAVAQQGGNCRGSCKLHLRRTGDSPGLRNNGAASGKGNQRKVSFSHCCYQFTGCCQ